MSGDPDDPVIGDLREQVADVDRAILDAFNRRLELVAVLKREKEGRGIGFLDPDREAWLLDHLTRSNRGPLSTDGVEQLLGAILTLTKDEIRRAEP